MATCSFSGALLAQRQWQGESHCRSGWTGCRRGFFAQAHTSASFLPVEGQTSTPPWEGESVRSSCKRDLLKQIVLTHKKQNFNNSTPPAKKTEPSNLVLRAQDHKKNPKFKGWQWDLKNPKFKIRSSKERRTKSEITEIVVEKYVFKIPKIQNFRNTRNQ